MSIRILEISPPHKLSGISSFIVDLEKYNEEAVNALKALPTFNYSKKDKLWEIPAHCLSQTLESLTFLDDIELTVLDQAESVKVDRFQLTEEEIKSFNFTPFQHQIEGVNFGLCENHPKWLLLDSMGLGKTNEIIMLAETLKRRGLIDHCLIICGVDSLRQNWKREIKKFSTESCIVLGEKISKSGKITYEPVKKRAEILKNSISEFFVIVNIAAIRSNEIVEAFKNSENKFGMIALDEAHRVQTKSSSQGTNLLKLDADYKVAMTGSMVTNNPISCFMPLAWTENDKATLTNFKSQYCEFGGFNNSQIIGYKNLDILREEIENCSVRRTLDQVRSDMPDKTIIYEILDMPEDHKAFYEAIKQGVKEEADKIELKASNLLALTTRLRQATVCPGILTSQDILSIKVERAVELTEDLVSQGEKVVIFSNFKEPVYQLAKLLEKYEPLVNTGDQDDSLVGYNVDKFQNDPNCKVFIGTHSKCGTGWTLNAASYLICLDTPFTHAAFSQSVDRIYRISNTRPAIAIVLACADSIDERVRDIIEMKAAISDYLVDGKENAISASLTDELRNIILTL